jgi:hypothetical protein
MVLATRNGFQLSGHLNGTVCPPAHKVRSHDFMLMTPQAGSKMVLTTTWAYVPEFMKRKMVAR